MSAPRAKRFEYAASVDRAGRISAEGGAPLALAEEWSPEALVLAGLGRCILTSLGYHARRAGLDAVGAAGAAGAVTKREADGRYAFVEIQCRLDVDLEPAPPGEELQALLAKAERDCFVSASLTVAPRYVWRVNGEDVAR
ncbi:MAG: OsmC family protein [Gaiellaceae bacterium]